MYMRLARPRKSSAEASQRPIRRRSSELQTARELVSGDSSSMQFQALSKEDRQKLLKEAGFSVEIPPETGLALKADL